MPKSKMTNILSDRMSHLNEALGHLIPQMRNVLALVEVEGFKLVFRPFTDDMNRIGASYEPSVRELLSPKDSDVVIDVGANIGRHSLWLSRAVGERGRVVAIEPDLDNFRVLKLNRTENHLRNLILVRAALADRQGKAQLIRSNPTAMGQIKILEQTGDANEEDRSDVDIETLDSIATTYGLQRISSIKIDVEGAEVSVLEGGSRTIARYLPRIVVEAHDQEKLGQLSEVLGAMDFHVRTRVSASSRVDESRSFLLATN